MMRLSKLADYGILLLVAMVRRGQAGAWSAREAAEEVGLPGPIVSKILKTLARVGILASQRGPNGGYRLAFPAEMTTVGQVITALEGPIAITECAEVAECSCEQLSSCLTKPNWLLINGALTDALERITLADMAADLGDEAGSVSASTNETKPAGPLAREESEA